METSAEDAITKLEKIMTKKLEEVQQTLKVSLLAEVTKNNKQFEDKMKGMIKENKSYAETVKNSQVAMNATPQSTNTIDLRSIIREEQNEQLAEESDKKKRSCNLILHGVRESITDDKNQAKQRDKEFITTFIGDVGLDIEYKSTYRLGKEDARKEQSKRPILVLMHSEQGKHRIMENLKQLKGQEKYQGISVTDDHTIKDRKLIKDWIDKAKEANASEPADSPYQWKVRGTPKNGMRLKKFQKRHAGE